MRNGSCFRRPPSALPTSASDSSSSPSTGPTNGPTARAADAEGCGNHPGAMDSLSAVASMWDTPQAHDAGSGRSQNNYNDPRHGAACLVNQTANWATPDANCHKGSAAPGQRVGQLDEQAEQLWARSHQVQGWVSMAWSINSENFSDEILARLGSAIRPSEPTPCDGSKSSSSDPISLPQSRRRLNEIFVEWLQGVPEGWTDFAPSATASSKPRPPTP